MGDFNYPDIDWETLTATDRASTDAKLFVECLMDNFYTQQVTSEPDMVDELLVSEGLGSSEHSMLLWTCQFGQKKRLTERIKLNYRKPNLDKIKKYIKYR